jgi:hypothetical protein
MEQVFYLRLYYGQQLAITGGYIPYKFRLCLLPFSGLPYAALQYYLLDIPFVVTKQKSADITGWGRFAKNDFILGHIPALGLLLFC